MKHYFNGALILTASAICACTSEIADLTPDEAYSREFTKQFGLVDPDHEWSAAVSTNVTVSSATPADMQVVADFKGKTYLFGEYQQLSGTHNYAIDLPRGYENLRVQAKASPSPGELTVTKEATGEIISSKIIRSALDILPEGNDNANAANVQTDFSFISTGQPITIYPVYWNTNRQLKVGVYYYDATGKYNESIIFDCQNRDDGDVMYYNDNSMTDYLLTFEPEHREAPVANEELIQSITPKDLDRPGWEYYEPYFLNPWTNLLNCKPPYPEPTEEEVFDAFGEWWRDRQYQLYPESTRHYTSYKLHTDLAKDKTHALYTWDIYIGDIVGEIVTIPDRWVDKNDPKKWIAFPPSKSVPNISEIPAISSKGITISLPEGTRFGFFSDSHSDVSYFTTTNNATDLYGEEKTVSTSFLSFDDGSFSAADLNDMIFMVDANSVLETNPTPFPWVIACEDLGGTFDHDFNDIVFGVQHVSGSEHAYITALAAGGTLPVHLYYQLTDIRGGSYESGDQYTVYSPSDTKEFNEWHQWFDKTSSQVTNVGSFKVGATVRIKVGDDFTMSGNPNNPNVTIGSDNHLGGFHIEVEQKDGRTTMISAPKITDDPGTNIPQMFVTTAAFEWPKENRPIYSTHRGDSSSGQPIGTTTSILSSGLQYDYYPNSFHAWVNDADNHSGFHSQPATEQGDVVHHNWSGYPIPLQP